MRATITPLSNDGAQYIANCDSAIEYDEHFAIESRLANVWNQTVW
jgi:hypothetical protein